MKNRNLDNTTLDAIGKKLIKCSSTPQSEIDRIVGDPRLFDLVARRIAAEQNSTRKLGSLSVARKVILAGVPTAAAIAAVVLAGLSTSDAPQADTEISKVPPTQAEEARPEIPPQGITEMSSAGRAKIVRASQPLKRRDTKPIRRKEKPIANEPDARFYAVAHNGEPVTAGRVVRIDLDRSSAFALGVDLPLENGVASIKADLLIGADGTTRGIRVVN